MKIKSLVIGFAAGTVLAGTAVLLSAPESGKNMRNRIKANKDEAGLLLLEIKERIKAVKADTTYAAKTGKETIQTFIGDVKVLLNSWKEEVEPNKEQLTNNISAIEASIQELEGAVASGKKN